jgi:uncharacterized protein (DUF1499 family)
MRALAVLAVVFLIVPLLLLAAGQFGFLRGLPPDDQGLRDGKLRPPSRARNSVSSQAGLWPAAEYDVEYAQIEPIRFSGDAIAAMNRLRDVLKAWPDAIVVDDRADYIAVEFETRWLRFVDDAEFLLDPAERVIHVRSKSRLGSNDYGVNRRRIEQLRRQFDLP